MNWDAIGAVGEIIGALAVVVSIGYLALQIRQNTRSLNINSEMAISDVFSDWVNIAIENPRIMEIWDIASEKPDSINEEDARLFIWFVAKMFLKLEGQFNLYRAGHITEAAWDTKLAFLLGILRNPIVAQWWEAKVAPFSPEYFEYINRRRASPDYQWNIKKVLNASEPST